MEKTRVPKGEMYWFINTNAAITRMWVEWDIEGRYPAIDAARLKFGNKFLTQEEAESMANKLRAVLKGAEVIETPAPDEVYKECKKRNPHIDEESIVGREWQEGFFACANFMKSKIVK